MRQHSWFLPIAIFVILMLLGLAACGGNWNGYGTVVGHEYDDPDFIAGYTIPGITTCSGNPPICTKQPDIVMPPYWTDEQHILVVQERGTETTHKIVVSHDLWNQCEDGWQYNKGTCVSP